MTFFVAAKLNFFDIVVDKGEIVRLHFFTKENKVNFRHGKWIT